MSSPLTTPMKSLTPGQRMATARAVAASKMPYFTAGVQSLVPREVPGFGTLGVTSESILIYDPEILAGWTPLEAGAVILHEWLHVYLRHAERFTRLCSLGVLDRSEDDRSRFNTACDVEVNQNILDAGLLLPKFPDGSECVTAKGMNLTPGKLAEEYVVELLKRRQKGGGSGKRGGKGWGHCGSGAGYPLPGEPENDPNGRSPGDQHVARQSASEQVRGAVAKGQGKVPAGLARWAEAELLPARVPWQQKLAMAVRAAVAQKNGMTDYTMSRPSRRQSVMGLWGRDVPVLPAMRGSQAEVAFAVDTSGSMGEQEMVQALSEVDACLRALGGARVTFLACDAAVHTVARVRSVQEARRGIKGGGGTSFVPVFQAVERVRPRPHLLVYFTDLYGTFPDAPPDDMHVIWIATTDAPVPFGEVVRYEA